MNVELTLYVPCSQDYSFALCCPVPENDFFMYFYLPLALLTMISKCKNDAHQFNMAKVHDYCKRLQESIAISIYLYRYICIYLICIYVCILYTWYSMWYAYMHVWYICLFTYTHMYTNALLYTSLNVFFQKDVSKGSYLFLIQLEPICRSKRWNFGRIFRWCLHDYGIMSKPLTGLCWAILTLWPHFLPFHIPL